MVLYGIARIFIEWYELYGFIWDWYGFLGFIKEFFLTLDVLKIGLVKP